MKVFLVTAHEASSVQLCKQKKRKEGILQVIPMLITVGTTISNHLEKVGMY